MNRRVLLFGDVWAEDSAPVDLDRRVDDFRAINSITPPEQIVSDLGSGRKFFHFLHYLTAAFFLRKLAALRRAPVAQLDRASDYGIGILNLSGRLKMSVTGAREFGMIAARRQSTPEKNPQLMRASEMRAAQRFLFRVNVVEFKPKGMTG